MRQNDLLEATVKRPRNPWFDTSTDDGTIDYKGAFYNLWWHEHSHVHVIMMLQWCNIGKKSYDHLYTFLAVFMDFKARFKVDESIAQNGFGLLLGNVNVTNMTEALACNGASKLLDYSSSIYCNVCIFKDLSVLLELWPSYFGPFVCVSIISSWCLITT